MAGAACTAWQGRRAALLSDGASAHGFLCLQVARSIRIVLNNGQAHVEVQLDTNTTEKLQVSRCSWAALCLCHQVGRTMLDVLQPRK